MRPDCKSDRAERKYKFIRHIGSDKTGHWEVARKEVGV